MWREENDHEQEEEEDTYTDAFGKEHSVRLQSIPAPSLTAKGNVSHNGNRLELYTGDLPRARKGDSAPREEAFDDDLYRPVAQMTAVGQQRTQSQVDRNRTMTQDTSSLMDGRAEFYHGYNVHVPVAQRGPKLLPTRRATQSAWTVGTDRSNGVVHATVHADPSETPLRPDDPDAGATRHRQGARANVAVPVVHASAQPSTRAVGEHAVSHEQGHRRRAPQGADVALHRTDEAPRGVPWRPEGALQSRPRTCGGAAPWRRRWRRRWSPPTPPTAWRCSGTRWSSSRSPWARRRCPRDPWPATWRSARRTQCRAPTRGAFRCRTRRRR